MLHRIQLRHIALKLLLSILLSVFACFLLMGIASPLSAQVTTTQPAVNFSVWVPVGAATGSTQTLILHSIGNQDPGRRFGPDPGRTKS